jgi:hypothetical protein
MDDLTPSISGVNDSAQLTRAPHDKLGRFLFLTLVVVFLALGLGLWLYNNIVADKPLQKLLSQDPRNVVVKEHAHFDGYYDAHTLIFDIDEVSGEATRMDVLRTFLQYAEAMKGQTFKKIVLSCKGHRKFEMDGLYFQQLGMEFQTQNPLYTIRTLPINVAAMDGSHPYTEYEGGILGVLSEDRWYGNELFLSGRDKK